MNESLDNLLRRAIALEEDGRRVIVCLLARSRGSTPQSAGAVMLVDDRMETWGTIGGGCVEAELRREAFRMLQNETTGLLTFKLDHDYGWDDGLLCGGTIELAVGPPPPKAELQAIVEAIEQRRATALHVMADVDDEPERFTLDIPARERLYIAGAGHVGQAVARIALTLGFDVSLFDDRADLLKRYAPDGTQQVPGEIADQLAAAPVDDSTFCVIVTRGHRHDAKALAAVVDRGARYIGMIGSRRKVKLTYDDLIEKGVSAETLENVHAPIGLAIGAKQVDEIAVSIVAELIQIRRSADVARTTAARSGS